MEKGKSQLEKFRSVEIKKYLVENLIETQDAQKLAHVYQSFFVVSGCIGDSVELVTFIDSCCSHICFSVLL